MNRAQEVKRLSGKLSYQGESLKQRIVRQMKAVERAKLREREAKRFWFRAQLALMGEEDESDLLFAVAIAEKKK